MPVIGHSLNALFPIVIRVSALFQVTVDNDVHPLNVPFEMFVNVLGRTTSVSAEQELNVPS